MRQANGTPDPTNSIATQTTRGFTGQERLADVGLVHMNGRVYDPVQGKFTSADPLTQFPMSTQGWNRYSYAGNNPLAFTDPSGHSIFSKIFHSIFHFIQSALRQIPVLGPIIEIAALVLICGTQPEIGCAVAVAGLSSFAVSGIQSGKLGVALKSGLIAAAEAGADVKIGDITSHGIIDPVTDTGKFFANVGLHAALGCAVNEAQSGHGCGAGALSGAVSAASGPLLDRSGLPDNVVIHSAIGGLASVAGGGKFGNGAVTGAFDYLLNQGGGVADPDADPAESRDELDRELFPSGALAPESEPPPLVLTGPPAPVGFLAGPNSGTFQAWAGVPISAINSEDIVAYRIYDSSRPNAVLGDWLMVSSPLENTLGRLRDLYTLPGSSYDTWVQVTIPAGTRFMIGTAAGFEGIGSGGGTQIRLLGPLPATAYGPPQHFLNVPH